jgi:uncharacterized protein (DUF1015 family)
MDASLVVGPPSVGRPLRLLPFCGWRLAAGRIGDPTTARLFARHYRDLGPRLDQWYGEEQLRRDTEPAVYVHEYTAGGLTVRGLVGALDMSRPATTPESRAVLPHEGVHPEQVSDLAARMQTWELDPAPILLVHRGPHGVRALVERTTSSDPLADLTDRVGQRHRLWAITEQEDLAVLDDGLARHQALIADGHHRYASFLRIHQGDGWEAPHRAGLAMLVDQSDTPLFLGAIHRVLAGVTLARLRSRCPPSIAYEAVSPAAALGTLAQDTLVATDGRSWATLCLREPDDRAPVERLHDELLPALAIADRRNGYHHSVEAALSRVRSKPGVAVLMPAPDVDLVLGVARAGRLLPEKATSFQPKPTAGVLMRSWRAG